MSVALELIGFAVGGETGARLARQLGLSVSPDSLLRRVRVASRKELTTPRIIGVDDFAFRRGQRYGTLLVDLEQRRPIDLLPDREAETLSAWLKAHPGMEIVTRDRPKTYASGITEGASAALQVADRWHLLKNLRETLEQLLKRLFPARGRRMHKSAPPAEEHPHTGNEYLKRMRLRLLPHLLRQGIGKGAKRAPPLRPPPPRDLAWMLLRPERIEEKEQGIIERLCQLFTEVKTAQEIALKFVVTVRQRTAASLPAWSRAATESRLKEFVGFARGVSEDYEAVRNTLTYEWSNGQLEGQVNRLRQAFDEVHL